MVSTNSFRARYGNMLRPSLPRLKRKYLRRVVASHALQSYHTTDIDPFSRDQWIAHPYQPKNMPSVAYDAKPHTSKKAVTHFDDTKGWFHIIDAKGWNVGRLSQKICGLLMVGTRRGGSPIHRTINSPTIF